MRRSILRNKRAVSEVVGFVLMITVASSVLAATVYTTSYIIDRKIAEVGSYQAKALANQIADAIVDATWVKRSLVDADYERIINLPDDIAGLEYYIQLTDDAVYVNSTDGRISERSTTYKAKELGLGASGKVYGGSGDIKIVCNKTDYVYRFDFGTYEGIENDTIVHSPVESGYYWVSNETEIGSNSRIHWADPSRPYRILLYLLNTVNGSKNVSKYWVSFTLDPSIFDYSLVNESGLDLEVYNFSGVRLPCWIEEWNPNGTSTIWFMIDNISKNETKCFYLYFGNKTPDIDWDFMFTPENSTGEIYNKFSDDNFLFYDDFDNLNNWRLNYAPTAAVDDGYAILSYNDTIISNLGIITKPGEPEENATVGYITMNTSLFVIEAKVNVTDDITNNKVSDVDVIPIMPTTLTPKPPSPSSRLGDTNIILYYPFCLPLNKVSSDVPNATSLWGYMKGIVKTASGSASGYKRWCLNTSIGASPKDRWTIVEINAYRAYVKDWSNTSWTRYREYNYTGIEIKCIDNITSQIYNYVYGYTIYNNTILKEEIEDATGESLPPNARISLDYGKHLGFSCGMFSSLNTSYTESTNQKAYIDWVSVRKAVLPQPVVLIGEMESIDYGWEDTSGIFANDTLNPNDLLLRDFNGAAVERKFKIVNLSAGTYSITITMGDNNESHDQMYVSASVDYYGGGTQDLGYVISNLNTGAGDFETEWFTVTLHSKGNISLTFSDADGTTAGDTGWVVNSIDIERGIKGVRVEVE